LNDGVHLVVGFRFFLGHIGYIHDLLGFLLHLDDGPRLVNARSPDNIGGSNDEDDACHRGNDQSLRAQKVGESMKIECLR
jgi:hypothetical protein